MPVWQEFYREYSDQGFELLAVAVDFQGAAKVRPYVEQAQATYPNAIDQDNALGLHFGFKAVPNAIFVDEDGLVRYTKFGGFDIRQPYHRDLTHNFVESPDLAEIERRAEAAGGFESAEALDHFRLGLALYQQGKTEAALAAWQQGVALEPDNWIIRKQVWAIENPERFYQGAVDFDWQRQQLAGEFNND